MAPGHYLYASAAAIEVTLLHNFVWHCRFTWRDQRDDAGVMARLARFHLSNGLVSMVGNLALMRVLVHDARMPVLAANCVAIVCCSVVNFCFGDGWAFAKRARA
jgi:putative flippase GtrA